MALCWVPDIGTMVPVGKAIGLVMRTLSKAAFAFACVWAFLSILFIAVATGSGSFANQVCTLGGSFCNRPSLMLIPAGVAVLWALMLRTFDER